MLLLYSDFSDSDNENQLESIFLKSVCSGGILRLTCEIENPFVDTRHVEKETPESGSYVQMTGIPLHAYHIFYLIKKVVLLS